MINQKETKQVRMDSWLLKLTIKRHENKSKNQRSTNKQIIKNHLHH